ncbi:hypothetical protein ACB092_07G035400 [Castanea dentata]
MSSPSSSMTSQWKYDVFLSFSGVDTRKKFTGHLFAALDQKGILTFIDNRLERGKLISSELLKTIEESRFAIIIFSKNYASSSWCLDELAAIVRCMKETGLTIFPIFYDVDPSDVRKQTGTFGQAFNTHEDKENIKKVETWRDALKVVADLSGWHLQDRHEAEFVQHIVDLISRKLYSKSPSFTKGLVGIDSSVEKLFTSYLGLVNKVCMIGICGMGGLGKTTLARAIYDKFSKNFEGSSFLSNVREVSEKGNLILLQRQLLKDILMERKIHSVDRAIDMIKNRLRRKKVLLVLDDVNQLDQLEKLAGEPDWFGLGSWIIITTRDKQLLVQHDVHNIYSPDVLNSADSLKLFCLKAFKNEIPEEGYKQLSQNIVHYAKDLPLALVTLGSFLFERTMEEWKSALFNFEQIPQGKIFHTLKVSYDGLEEMWKEIFLDIACFFRGKTEGRVLEILKYRGFDARIGIKVLMERSLITIENKRLWMHDLLQEMGRQIVLESHKKPEKRSRLWSFEDLLHVLKKDTAAEALQAIVLNRYEWERQDWNFETYSEAFSKMCNLRLLIIHNVHIPNGLNHVSNSLRFLQWIGYPSECLPSSFQPKELLELSLRDSKMKFLWKGVKYLDNLKCMDLRYSKYLIETPDFRGVPGHKRLDLSQCNNLVAINLTIELLRKLLISNLYDRASFANFPSMSSEMESLEILELYGCSKLRKIPEFKGIMRSLSLSELHLDKTTTEKLPSSIEFLTTLTLLSELKVLRGQSNWSQDSQPWSQWPGYNESSVEVTFTKLNHYLQGLLCPKTGYETSIRRKEDGFGIAFQTIILGYEIPWWITHQRLGNSISIELPPNWCNSKWMGFALCASLDAPYSHISVEEFHLTGKTFGLKVHVIARGDMPHSYYATEISCSTKLVARHIWLLHLSRDDWFATARSGEFNQIEVVFESTRPGLYVRKCGLSLVYKQDVEMFTQTMCSSNRITLEGCDGSHDEFDNLWRNCDDYNDNEPGAICSSSEEIESCISSVNGIQILYPSNISVSHQKNCYCPARATLKTIFTTHENFGRRFWTCGKIKQNVNCGFFEWEDPEMCSYGQRVIHQLQERLEKIDKDKVDQHELVMLREENKNLRIALLFFGIALLFSWIAIVIYLYYIFISRS